MTFSQNFEKFEKQVQTLESVHPLISKYRQAVKKTRLYLEVRERTLTRVWTHRHFSVHEKKYCTDLHELHQYNPSSDTNVVSCVGRVEIQIEI